MTQEQKAKAEAYAKTVNQEPIWGLASYSFGSIVAAYIAGLSESGEEIERTAIAFAEWLLYNGTTVNNRLEDGYDWEIDTPEVKPMTSKEAYEFWKQSLTNKEGGSK